MSIYTIALMTNNSSTYYQIAVLLLVVIIIVVMIARKYRKSFSFTTKKVHEGELIYDSDNTLNNTNPLYGGNEKP